MTFHPFAPEEPATSTRCSGDQPATQAPDSRQSVLVAAGDHTQSLGDVWAALLGAARGPDPTRAAPNLPDAATPAPPAPPVAAVRGATEMVSVARALLDAGYDRLVIVPLSVPDGSSRVLVAELAEAVDTLRLAYPGAHIHDAGRALDSESARALGDLVAVPQQVSDERLAGAIARGFDGEPGRLASFLAVLRRALPADTTIALRGSSVMGRAFRDGAPYDAGGRGSSDLDVVLIGPAAADLWVPEARLLGGINTLPLNDEASWVAPALEAARREAQAMVGRPLSIQAMASWFLDLRVAVQGQQYVVLSGQP